MRTFLWPLVGLAIAAPVCAQVSYSRDLAPILSSKCVQCHDAKSKMGNLDLTAAPALLRVAGAKSADSSLYLHLTGKTQPQMPMGGHLTDPQIALFRDWIDAGARIDSQTLSSAQKPYWFFQPVAKPAVPKVAAGQNASPVDAFILAKLNENHITPNSATDKTTLLRRATLDLTGLPPTPEETQSFLADDSPKAFEKVVDRLLASPHYGERWGREWLDLARYADTNGFKADEPRPNIWRYRDYVIQSFNDDKPYDRFIREQIAGDQLYPDDLNARIATGFLRHYTDETNQPVIELRRQELLSDITDTVGGVFMGLTVGCAKCHDHKFDPILQKDYYRLQSFFANVRADDNTILLQGEKLEAYRKQLAEYNEKTNGIRAEMDALVEPFAQQERDYYTPRFSTGTQEAIRTPDDQRTPYQSLLAIQGMPQIVHPWETFTKKLKPEQKKRFDELAAQLKSFDALKPNPPVAQTMIENGPVAPKTYVLVGGEWSNHGPEVQPGFLSILDPNDVNIAAGRRAALANWLADPKNPMTARVMVNRIWQGHFGTGIVASSSDFGTVGDRPSNQQLLDYLAATFVENGWSIKKMHRAIMLSNVYQESSLAQTEAMSADPENKLMWRYPRHRVEGEVLRDAMLMTSGKLNLKIGGPGIHPDLPPGVNAVGYAAWPADKDKSEDDRRSVYVFVKRVLTYPMFEAFDEATSEESCPRRFSTVVPSQALTLMNDKYVLDWSRSLAGRVLGDTGLTREQQINRAYRIAFGRAPEPDEVTAVSEFLTKQTALVTGRMTRHEPVLLPDQIPAGTEQAFAAAFVDFAHALMSSNEFLYIN